MVGGINGLLAYANRSYVATETRDAVHRRRDVNAAQRSDARVAKVDPHARPEQGQATQSTSASEPPDRTTKSHDTAPGQHNKAEQREVERLKARDREVRAHESAHKAAAGQHAHGAPSYSYTTGPDGRQYATGGSVSIDTSAVPNDPEKTLAKMEQVRAAALAPADPSGQDVRVAAKAAQNAAEARREILQEKLEAPEGKSNVDESDSKQVLGEPANAQAPPRESELSASLKRAYTQHEARLRIDIRA